MHGGKALSGIAAPALKTGRYSKHLPTRLMDRYQEARIDADLLALRDDIALLDARLEDVLAKVDTGEAGETWRALQETVHEFEKAERGANSTTRETKKAEYNHDREEAMRTIIVLCQAGMSDYAAWNEVKALLEQRRKHAETEQKRLVAMQQMITASDAVLMQTAILDIIKRNVTDRATLIALSADFGKLALGGAGRGT